MVAVSPDMRGHLANKNETNLDQLQSKCFAFSNFTKTCPCRDTSRDPTRALGGAYASGFPTAQVSLVSWYFLREERKKRGVGER